MLTDTRLLSMPEYDNETLLCMLGDTRYVSQIVGCYYIAGALVSWYCQKKEYGDHSD